MKVVVDADACPVRAQIVEAARARGVAVVMVYDNTHRIDDGYSKCVVVDKGADSADVALANLLSRGDIAVTGDFGAATLALARGAYAISFSGMRYDESNIDKLLFERFLGKKVRRGGGRTKGPHKRDAAQDTAFARAFGALLDECCKNEKDM